MIGQLPKEIGGNYTTGAANVVYELSKHKAQFIELYTLGTNISAKTAKKVSLYKNQYIGYSIRPFAMIWRLIKNPISSIKSLVHYKKVDNQSPIRYFIYEENIARAIKAVSPEIIHVNSIGNISPAHFALGGMNIPILLTCHGIFYRGDTADKIGRRRYLGNISFADAYSGLTEESVNEYEMFLGVPKEKVSVIPNGVDCNKFYFSLEDRKIIRKKYNISDSCNVFITVASIQERKGQLEFIKLLSKLDIEYQYWIIGRGPDEDTVKEFVASNNLEKKIKFFGYLNSSQLYKYYSAADFYAHPSWKEGQALSELEANATGLRTIVNKAVVDTIASDLNSEDYYVVDFINLDLSSLYSWIKLKRGNRASRTNFHWEVISEKYANLYRQLLKNKL